MTDQRLCRICGGPHRSVELLAHVYYQAAQSFNAMAMRHVKLKNDSLKSTTTERNEQ